MVTFVWGVVVSFLLSLSEWLKQAKPFPSVINVIKVI